MRRILTAVVGLPLLFWIIKYLPPQAFMILVAAAVVLGTYEFYAIVDRRGIRPHKALGAALAVAAAYSFFDPDLGLSLVLAATILLVPVASLIRVMSGRGLDGELLSIAATMHAVLYVGVLMGYSLALLDDGGEMGRDLTVLLFWVVWLSDAGAFAVGSLIGRRRLARTVSPGKTLEGAAGAIVVAVAAAFVARSWFFTRLQARDAILLGVLLGLAGMVGDLVESLLKRGAGVKDSGWLFPGHGGMLDRTDSLLFAAPVLFYYHEYVMR